MLELSNKPQSGAICIFSIDGFVLIQLSLVMEKELKARLVFVASLYAESRGLMLSTVALRAVKDARFFDRITEGRGFNVRTYDAVMQWFSDNWDETVAWPSHVERPAKTPPVDAET